MSKFYRHFRGNVYKVLHVAKHSETLEETIVRDGVEIKRFTEISEEEANA